MRRFAGCLLGLLLTVAPLRAGGADKEPITDNRIHDQVLLKLAGDIDVRGGNIEVQVANGVVTLTGKVATAKQRSRAEHLAKKVKGVTSVEDKIVISK